MNMKSRKALDAHFQQAASWGKDQQEGLRKSRRTAWIVASVIALIAVGQTVALIELTPLKTVEPYTLMVDKQTGFVQVLKPLQTSEISGNTALTQSFLVQYVIARESFDIDSIQANYNKIGLWSEGAARAEYVADSQPTNPNSLVARLPRSAVLETHVKSVSPMAANTAMVRFETVRRDGAAAAQPAQAWVAVIHYRYSGEPMKLDDRFVNPLGFEVTRYQRSAESLDPAPNASPTAAPSGSSGLTGRAGVAIPAPVPTTQLAPPAEGRRLPNGDTLTL